MKTAKTALIVVTQIAMSIFGMGLIVLMLNAVGA